MALLFFYYSNFYSFSYSLAFFYSARDNGLAFALAMYALDFFLGEELRRLGALIKCCGMCFSTTGRYPGLMGYA